MLYRKSFQHLQELERKRIAPTPEGHLRLQRLERPAMLPGDVISQVWENQPPINFYPDYAAAHRKMSAFMGVHPDNLVMGAGIEDFIRTLIMLSCDPKQGFAYTWPTCAMFDVYAKAFQCDAVRFVMDPDKPYTVDELAFRLDFQAHIHDVKLFILPNPGQPVDICYSLDELKQIAQVCLEHGAILAIDEAYYGFGAPTALPLIEDFANVVVLRTFSKAFGAAAIRVGCAMGHVHAVKPLDAIRQSGEISGPSIHAAGVIMDNYEEHVQPAIDEIVAGRDFLKNILLSAGIPARGSYANHVLADFGSQERAQEVERLLLTQGVHVRGGYPDPLDHHLLITAGPVPMMEQLAATLAIMKVI